MVNQNPAPCTHKHFSTCISYGHLTSKGCVRKERKESLRDFRGYKGGRDTPIDAGLEGQSAVLALGELVGAENIRLQGQQVVKLVGTGDEGIQAASYKMQFFSFL